VTALQKLKVVKKLKSPLVEVKLSPRLNQQSSSSLKIVSEVKSSTSLTVPEAKVEITVPEVKVDLPEESVKVELV
jgi:hypothetical protein